VATVRVSEFGGLPPFIVATRRCFAKYGDFSGRASRSEYWWFQGFVLGVLLASVFAGLLAVPMGAYLNTPYLQLPWWLVDFGADRLLRHEPWIGVNGVSVILQAPLWLGVLPPMAAVTVRRLHDTGVSGWWALLVFVPAFGTVFLLLFMLSPSNVGSNRYGFPSSLDVVE
jgi:uncharacterized membrane protein YhaH (DUF805 family)